jgi:hypothetical protein
MAKRFKKPKPVKRSKPSPAALGGEVVTVVGFEDFWQTSYDAFPDFFGCMGRVNALMNKFRNAPVNGKLPLVIHAMAALVSNSFGAIVVLGANGYGHDAVRITRSMFETMVNAKYIKLRPDEVDDYLDFHWVRKMEIYEYFKQYAPSELSGVPQAEIAALIAEFDAVKAKFTNRNGKARKAWCKNTFRACTEAVGLTEYYPTFYAEASDFAHGNIKALIAQTEQSLMVKAAPSLCSVKTALRIGHLSLLGVLDVLNDVAALGFDQEIKDAGKDFQKVWHQQPKA